MFSPTILLLLFLLWCFHFFWKRRRLYRLSWNVPGPLNLPIIGAAYIALRGTSELAMLMIEAFDTYPNLFKAWLGPHLIYFTSKPEHAKIMLNSPAAIEKAFLMKYIKDLEAGLVTCSAKMWKRHRKIIAPSMSRNILNKNPKVISEHCLVLIEKLEECSGKGEIDPCKYITNCAIDIIGDTLCGFQINAQKNNETYSEAMEKSLQISFIRMSSLFYQFDFIFSRSKLFKIQNECINKIKNLIQEISENIKHKNNKPFLSLMHEQIENNQFTENELENEIFTFIIAGTDTNAISTCMLLTLLALHQEIQQKVYEEVVEVVGSGLLILLESLQKLEYTKRVIKETLRLFPTVPLIGRTLTDDLVLDETIIPKGAELVLNILAMHRSEKYWEEPLKFDPDRFLPENLKNNHPYQWLPFSGGPRNCIGIKHAEMTMSIMTAMIIRKFKVSTSLKSLDDMELATNIVLKPKKGFKLAFELR